MINFHGYEKEKAFFEGWYLKHQTEEDTIAFIPAYHIDEEGKASASIQVIMNRESFVVPFQTNEFLAARNHFYVKIGESLFTRKGIGVNIVTDDYEIKGKLYYSAFTPLRYDIMGPFHWLPFMQCNHGLLSLYHEVTGTLRINGKPVSFLPGMGYIEKDWGTSFPESYFWTQCNWIEAGKCCVMVSLADIPFKGYRFAGCIASVYYQGYEYRLATYLGAQIVKCTEKEVILQQGKYYLRICLLERTAHRLLAPNKGKMERVVWENISCHVKYQFWVDASLLFQHESKKASYESSGISIYAAGDL